MKISHDEQDGVAVVRFEGNLDTNTAPEAQEALDDLIGAGTVKVLVDFSDLDYISSAGLRVLLATAKKLRGGGGNLRLCGLNETVAEVFEISGFSTIFAVFPSEAEALEGF
ncbi:MAG: STAS domain-containing protein [Gemmatimonadales bacterium]|nr:MAG: STAS domain-containing protein [Gemmatimonadales bacterium]